MPPHRDEDGERNGDGAFEDQDAAAALLLFQGLDGRGTFRVSFERLRFVVSAAECRGQVVGLGQGGAAKVGRVVERSASRGCVSFSVRHATAPATRLVLDRGVPARRIQRSLSARPRIAQSNSRIW